MRKIIALILILLLSASGAYAAEPEVAAQGAVLIDADTGRVLWGKNENEPMPMASTTKIMTAIIALENADLNDIVTISARAASAPEVKMHLHKGEQIKLEYLVYAMLLNSYNDAAVAVAEHVGGSVEGFCDMMTRKAAELGCTDTVFKTPNGLDAEGHHSTARDMAMIAAYAVKNDDFIKISNTPQLDVASADGRSVYSLVNKNRLLREFDGAIGVKTGFTGLAGQCFAGAARRNGVTLVSVVLASGWGSAGKEKKWTDTKSLLNYGFDNYSMEKVIQAGDQAGSLELMHCKTPEIGLEYAQDVSLLLSKEELLEAELKADAPKAVEAPVEKGQKVGECGVYINGELCAKTDIVTTEGAERNDMARSIEKIGNYWFNSGDELIKRIMKAKY